MLKLTPSPKSGKLVNEENYRITEMANGTIIAYLHCITLPGMATVYYIVRPWENFTSAPFSSREEALRTVAV